jgi:DNA modification methylase
MLYYGDNLDVMRRCIADESVDLCYIDPPFNSKRNYNQIYNNVGVEDLAQARAFVDTWKWDDYAIDGFDEILTNRNGRFHSKTIELMKGLHRVLGEGCLFAYLVSMTMRMVEIHRILKSTGSFYIHCDPTASHYLKLVLDGVFCSQGGHFQNELVWKRTHAHGSARRFGPVHDVLLFYTKGSEFVWSDPKIPHDEEYVRKHFKNRDSAGRYFQPITLTGTGIRHGESGRPWRGVNPTKVGRHWAVPGKIAAELGITGDTVQERLEALDAAGMIYWPDKEDGTPRLKWYADRLDGSALPDMWTDIDPLSANDSERLGYPTQKPVALLKRIISASSNEGDVIFDPFCGCGTTIDAAHELHRRWIGIDITYQSIALIMQRLEDRFGKATVEAVVLGGAPKDMKAAIALAHKKDDRVRKEFEKWAVLTYTNNRGAINEKKGADSGIDGCVYFLTSANDNGSMVFQVKSGGVGRGDVAKLHGDMEREGAQMATLITLEEPTAPMKAEAKAAGHYRHELMGEDYAKIRIVTVREIVEQNKRLDLPLSKTALRAAQRHVPQQESLTMPGLDDVGRKKAS